MKRVLLIFSTVFAAGLANGFQVTSQTAPQYEGMFEAKGTSLSGANYDRRFKLSVQFLPRTDILGTAQVDESQNVEASVTYCKTHLSLELGKIQIQARDSRTSETVTQTLPWTSNVVDTVEKSGDAPCSASHLEGKSVIGNVSHTFELKSAVHGKSTTLFIEAEPIFAEALPGDYAMASVLKKVSGDQYAIVPFAPNTQALVNWLYVHEVSAGLNWGSSGSVTLKLKN
jgi:hypothetical protein